MNKDTIHALVDDAGHGRRNIEEVVSQFTTLEDFNEARAYCKTCITPAYDRDQDMGDKYAKTLLMTKLHAIDHLGDKDKMTFISEQ